MTTFDVSPEHSPLSGIDEYFVHNYPTPTRVMWTSDPQAYERMWLTCQDSAGEILVVCGMGFYPNLGTADAFAIVNCRGQHTTVRAHRSLGDNRMDRSMGPLNFEVVQPFREWRISLADNEYGVAFDIRWFDTKRAVFRNLQAGTIHDGRISNGTAGYDVFGHQEGWIRVNGETFTVTRGAYQGTRDHHWGTRDGVGGPTMYRGPQWPFSGQWVEFAEWGAWGEHITYNLGDPRPGSETLRRRDHRLRFEPATKLLLSGEIDMHFQSGVVKTMKFERLGNQVAFLRCGMYGGPNGGTPDGNIWHGMYVGENVVTGETYDLNDPKVRARLAGLDQIHARCECEGEVAYGLIESYDPLCYEVASAGNMDSVDFGPMNFAILE